MSVANIIDEFGKIDEKYLSDTFTNTLNIVSTPLTDAALLVGAPTPANPATATNVAKIQLVGNLDGASQKEWNIAVASAGHAGYTGSSLEVWGYDNAGAFPDRRALLISEDAQTVTVGNDFSSNPVLQLSGTVNDVITTGRVYDEVYNPAITNLNISTGPQAIAPPFYSTTARGQIGGGTNIEAQFECPKTGVYALIMTVRMTNAAPTHWQPNELLSLTTIDQTAGAPDDGIVPNGSIDFNTNSLLMPALSDDMPNDLTAMTLVNLVQGKNYYSTLGIYQADNSPSLTISPSAGISIYRLG